MMRIRRYVIRGRWRVIALVLAIIALLVRLTVWFARDAGEPAPAQREDSSVSAEPCPSAETAGEGEPYPCGSENARFRIVEGGTAHGVLVLHVEMPNPDAAMTAARSLVEPVRDRYDGVLVYVLRPGNGKPVLVRRVEWSRTRGYIETLLENSR